jgi:hypothetical protein
MFAAIYVTTQFIDRYEQMNDANKIRILEEALYTCRELREFDKKEIARLRAKVAELLDKLLESNK